MGKLRVGLVGTGFMASVHARAARTHGAEIVGVVGSHLGAAQRAIGDLGANAAYADLDELLAAGVDLLHVCTPNDTHALLVEMALDAGIHVVCEKPLATSLPEAVRLRDQAVRAGVVAAVPFVYRYYASVRTARDRLRDGGHAPWLLHGSYLQDWLADGGVWNWRIDTAAGGATRAFGDIGIHWCDLMEFVTGQRITAVNASFGQAYAERTDPGGRRRAVSTEDGAVISFRTDLGAIGSVVVSQATAGRKNRLSFSFDGTDSTYAFDQDLPELLWIGGRDQNVALLRDPARDGVPDRFDPLPAGHPQGYRECFADFTADVYAAIRGDRPVELPTFDDGVRATAIAEAVVQSAATASWTSIPAVLSPSHYPALELR